MTKPLVLITGATGHIGFRTLCLLLQANYRARISLRRPEQAQKIKAAESIKPYLKDIEFVQVPDITQDHAFDEAVKDVEYVLHIASPIFDTQNQVEGVRNWAEELYNPALRGTLSILNSAKSSASVKRVVITSSVVVLMYEGAKKPADPYDIAPTPSKSELDSYNSAGSAYIASKVLSHRAASEFMDTNSLHFDLVRTLPGYVQGGNELATSADDLVRGSSEGTINTALGKVIPSPKPANQILLDDVARAHVFALDKSKVKGGQNLVLVGGGGAGWKWDEFVPYIEDMYSAEIAKGIFKPRKGQKVYDNAFDIAESEKSLGFKFAGPREMVKSVLDSYLQLLGKAEQ